MSRQQTDPGQLTRFLSLKTQVRFSGTYILYKYFMYSGQLSTPHLLLVQPLFVSFFLDLRLVFMSFAVLAEVTHVWSEQRNTQEELNFYLFIYFFLDCVCVKRPLRLIIVNTL